MSFNSYETSRNLGQPYQLTEFASGNTTYRFTTADQPVVKDLYTYLPSTPMQSVEIKETNVDDKGKLNFKVARDHEVAELFLVVVPRTISLRIFAGHIGEPEHITIWSGRVVGCEWDEEDQATISCESMTTILSRNGLPYKFGSTCQHSLYRGGCRLDLFANSYLFNVTSFTGNFITFPELIGFLPTNGFDGGLVIAKGYDYRMIVGFNNSTGTVELLRPFEGLEVGEPVRVAHGCNRTSTRCMELDNFENFLGFDTVPDRNPFEGILQTGVTIGGIE